MDIMKKPRTAAEMRQIAEYVQKNQRVDKYLGQIYGRSCQGVTTARLDFNGDSEKNEVYAELEKLGFTMQWMTEDLAEASW